MRKGVDNELKHKFKKIIIIDTLDDMIILFKIYYIIVTCHIILYDFIN
jgi:hypothetical protein